MIRGTTESKNAGQASGREIQARADAAALSPNSRKHQASYMMHLEKSALFFRSWPLLSGLQLVG